MWAFAGSHGIAFNAVGPSVVICKKPTAQTRSRGYQLQQADDWPWSSVYKDSNPAAQKVDSLARSSDPQDFPANGR